MAHVPPTNAGAIGASARRRGAAMFRASTRTRTAVRMRADGASMQEIAKAIGVSNQRASQILRAAMDRIGTDIDENARQIRAHEAMRLELAAEILWRKAKKGDLAAMDRWQRNRESYRRLLGLDLARGGEGTGGQTVIVVPTWSQNGLPSASPLAVIDVPALPEPES